MRKLPNGDTKNAICDQYKGNLGLSIGRDEEVKRAERFS